MTTLFDRISSMNADAILHIMENMEEDEILTELQPVNAAVAPDLVTFSLVNAIMEMWGWENALPVISLSKEKAMEYFIQHQVTKVDVEKVFGSRMDEAIANIEASEMTLDQLDRVYDRMIDTVGFETAEAFTEKYQMSTYPVTTMRCMRYVLYPTVHRLCKDAGLTDEETYHYIEKAYYATAWAVFGMTIPGAEILYTIWRDELGVTF